MAVENSASRRRLVLHFCTRTSRGGNCQVTAL